MQGVAAKDDASYDLSRARASVAGQTTIAALLRRRPGRTAHRDGPLCRRPVSQCIPAFRARAMVAKSILRTLGGTPI